MQVRKVVIPVAGWGTRSLPATKNVPKEILPVFRKPSIQYIVEEAIASGLSDVVFVNNQNKRIIEDHFDYNLALEQLLERKGQTELLAEVRKVAMMANIIVVRQKEQLGLGHAVLCAREVIKDEPFAVMVGDDLMFNRDPGINQLLEVWKNERMPVVGVMEVPATRSANTGSSMPRSLRLACTVFAGSRKSPTWKARRPDWPWWGGMSSPPRFSATLKA